MPRPTHDDAPNHAGPNRPDPDQAARAGDDAPPGAASVRQRLWGSQRAAIERALHTLDPDLAALITDVVYETVLARPGLDLKTRELLAVTALVSVGGERELTTHLRGALRCGATVGELKEVIIQAAMFVGFPKALAAMRALRALEALTPEPR